VIAYVVRRLLGAVPLLLLISLAVFSLTFLIPGDPARQILGPNASASSLEHLRHQLGLDRPLLVQYWRWLTNALHGNLGHSLLRNTAVSGEIARRFPVTFSIAIGALALTVVVGLPLGVLAATRPASAADRAVTIGTSLMLAVPDFWLAILLVLLFSVKLKVLPAIGYVPLLAITGGMVQPSLAAVDRRRSGGSRHPGPTTSWLSGRQLGRDLRQPLITPRLRRSRDRGGSAGPSASSRG
jgi:peptide/nickel transport system permease protein